jgi:hypothetical protein
MTVLIAPEKGRQHQIAGVIDTIFTHLPKTETPRSSWGTYMLDLRNGNQRLGHPPYITPKDVLAGRPAEIHAERERKLEEARKQRQVRRQQDG